MVCSHCSTQRPIKRPIKNGLCRIVQGCSYYTETNTNIDSHGAPCQFISICTCPGLCICLGFGQCEQTLRHERYLRKWQIPLHLVPDHQNTELKHRRSIFIVSLTLHCTVRAHTYCIKRRRQKRCHLHDGFLMNLLFTLSSSKTQRKILLSRLLRLGVNTP